MAANLSVTPDSVEIENLGNVNLHIANFDTNAINASGGRSFYSSSLAAIAGYWFNPTDTPTTASLNAVDVSLISNTIGQFRFTSSEGVRQGKLYVLTLS